MVWYSKYPRKALTDSVEIQVKEIIKEVGLEKDVELLDMEVIPKHVHLLRSVDP